HTKNISFLMNHKGQWKLSPAYDVTYAYNPSGIWTNSHQMAVHGKRDNITHADLWAVAHTIGYKQGREEIQYILDKIHNWHDYANRAGIPRKQAKVLQTAFRFNL
ncbi:MAG: HipA domain-containing protein, partial [Bacteroidota bacterium]